LTPPPVAEVPSGLRGAILAWYDARGRSLPFRGTTDPYAVLVSEVMAQQTQISRVAPAWSAFMATFPTVSALADATPADVLRSWRGLGYNRRGLNLWRAARSIVDEHGGAVPSSVEALERLPGIGPYTARAVAAIAFGAPVGAVDTNVRRVLSRAVVGRLDGVPAAELQRLANAAVPPERPADWTHALMDVGATFCRPLRPECESCPASAWCRYVAGGRETGVARRAGGPERAPFRSSSRWLRGKILDRLREARDASWVDLDERIGVHGMDAVATALARMSVEGLLERHPERNLTARLPLNG
jgi:A/G-specific adenine glycosylase